MIPLPGRGRAPRRLLALPASLLAFTATAAAQETPAADPPADPPEVSDMAKPTPPPPDAILPEVEPIIEDEEFDRAIPPIAAEDDPELDVPLESIAEFERRQAAAAATRSEAPPGSEPAPIPALADGDPVEAIGDAPISDAELAAPLPPLDGFNVEPVEFAEPESADETVRIAYTVQINGLAEADDSTDADLADLFNDLSALREGKGEAANAAMVRARLTADAELMQRVLASEGYYDARIDTRLDRGGDGNAVSNGRRGQSRQRPPLIAIIDVAPGKRYTLSDIVINTAPTVPPTLIRDNFPLTVGEPIVAERVQGAEAAIAIKLPEEGYPFATVGQRDILLDGATGDGVYTLPVEVGPRARFGDFRTTGNLAFDAEHAQKLARFRRGQLYDSRMVDDLRQALVATGLFATVAVEPQRTGESAGDDTEYVTMLVTQEAGPPRTIAASAGYGTGQGIRLEGSWTHRNLFPPEGALIVRGIAGTQEQALGVIFRRSNAGRRDRTFELIAEASRNNYNAFEAFTGRLGARVSYDSTPIWQKKFTYAYGLDLIATSEDDYDFTRGVRDRDLYYIAGLTGQLGMDRTDSLLDPTKGFRITTLLQPEGSLSGRFSPYARARLDVSGYYPVSDGLVLAGRVRVGSILGAARERLAPSRRFYAGGGGSVRGFGYQELGPKDPDNNPIGGRSVNEAAIEARYRFGNYGIVGFVDAGQVYRGSTPTFSDMRFGVGIGGRFYTNFGPMRLDIATPINRQPGESRISVYVSIGQAF
ncbi:MAG TPA: BamA/TamA family outer membrane protein [Sphingopyxis sp.]|nr:BamA/TamA family outer membrane protein [Sphingopyxis sp.]HMQ19373.1 BamA/TamA family outer membrane protein [Sphingopyxis sp.]